MSELAIPKNLVQYSTKRGFSVTALETGQAPLWEQEIQEVIDPEFMPFAKAGVSAVVAATRFIVEDKPDRMAQMLELPLHSDRTDLTRTMYSNILDLPTSTDEDARFNTHGASLLKNGLYVVEAAHAATVLKNIGGVTDGNNNTFSVDLPDELRSERSLKVAWESKNFYPGELTDVPPTITASYVPNWRLRLTGHYASGDSHYANISVQRERGQVNVQADRGYVKHGEVDNLHDSNQFTPLRNFDGVVTLFQNHRTKTLKVHA